MTLNVLDFFHILILSGFSFVSGVKNIQNVEFNIPFFFHRFYLANPGPIVTEIERLLEVKILSPICSVR